MRKVLPYLCMLAGCIGLSHASDIPQITPGTTACTTNEAGVPVFSIPATSAIQFDVSRLEFSDPIGLIVLTVVATNGTRIGNFVFNASGLLTNRFSLGSSSLTHWGNRMTFPGFIAGQLVHITVQRGQPDPPQNDNFLPFPPRLWRGQVKVKRNRDQLEEIARQQQ